jgi:lipoprotein-anchoring transpeptidase ErfK/SrfK
MMKRIRIYYFVIVLLASFLICSLSYLYLHFKQDQNKVAFLIVDKVNLRLNVINLTGDTLHQFMIAVGTNLGDKEKVGDLRTPEGMFTVQRIEDSESWKYDFEDDDTGPVPGAYGPYFIRLLVPKHKGIGIHGTHDNSTIGKRVSHGCIRMKNEDLLTLVDILNPGIPVLINEDQIAESKN